MPRRPRPLTEHDSAVWQAFARDIRPLRGRVAPAATSRADQPQMSEPPPRPAAPPPAPSLPRAAKRAVHATLTTGTHPAGLDRASWHRFSGGRMVATRTLDLHGKTAQAAFQALRRFLHDAAADHVRCVEIITGRGSGESGGVIRRELPLWLNGPDLRPLILAAAHPHALNPGSTRLLLRRARMTP
jgi:DNA-nicking Smr family endonuclease